MQLLSLAFWFYYINNLRLLHLLVIGEILLLAWFYQTILREYISVRIIWAVAILFALFSIINSLFFEKIYTFNYTALTIESILIVIVTTFSYIVFFNKIIQKRNPKELSCLNWINSGLFIYHSSGLLISYFSSTILNELAKSVRLNIWIVHSFVSVVMYTFFNRFK